MAELLVQGEQLVVRLSAWEKIAAGRRSLSVPLSAVTGVTVEAYPYKALRGSRSPGVSISGVLAYGLWRSPLPQRDFVALHGLGPAVRVLLNADAPYGAIIATVADARAAERKVFEAAGLPAVGHTNGLTAPATAVGPASPLVDQPTFDPPAAEPTTDDAAASAPPEGLPAPATAPAAELGAPSYGEHPVAAGPPVFLTGPVFEKPVPLAEPGPATPPAGAAPPFSMPAPFAHGTTDPPNPVAEHEPDVPHGPAGSQSSSAGQEGPLD